MQHDPLTTVERVVDRNGGLQIEEFTAGGYRFCLPKPFRIHCVVAAVADRKRAELFKYSPRRASET